MTSGGSRSCAPRWPRWRDTVDDRILPGERGQEPLILRPEHPSDHDAIRRVVADAFGSDAEADLVDRIRVSPEYAPEMALVAELDGEIAGHVMISGATIRNDAGDTPIVMLSPLAVAPREQRIGIGSALVRAAATRADQRGEPLVVLEGSPAYYARFGFEAAAAFGIELPLPDWAPAEAAQVLRLSSFDPHDHARRGRVIYPSAFDGLG